MAAAAMILSFENAGRSSLAATRPCLSTTIRWQIAKSSSSSDETTSMAIPFSRSLFDQAVDLGLGSNVDAARRLVEQQQARLGRDPTAEDHPLLVAARERARRLFRRLAAHVRDGARSGRLPALGSAPQEHAMPRDAAQDRERDVPADRRVDAAGPVPCDPRVRERRRPARIPRAVRTVRPAVDRHLASGRRPGAHDHVQQACCARSPSARRRPRSRPRPRRGRSARGCRPAKVARSEDARAVARGRPPRPRRRPRAPCRPSRGRADAPSPRRGGDRATTRPLRSTTIRSATARTSLRRWPTKITIPPRVAWSRAICSTWSDSAGPSAEVGSSRISTSGRRPSALAISSICRCATDSESTRRRVETSRPTAASSVLRGRVHRAPVDEQRTARSAAGRAAGSPRRSAARRAGTPARPWRRRAPGHAACRRSSGCSASGDGAGVGPDRSGDDAHHRRLAGAVLADEADHLTATQRRGGRRRERRPGRSSCGRR